MNYDFVALTVRLQEILEKAKDKSKPIDRKYIDSTIRNVRNISHSIEMSLSRIGNLMLDIEQAIQQREPADDIPKGELRTR